MLPCDISLRPVCIYLLLLNCIWITLSVFTLNIKPVSFITSIHQVNDRGTKVNSFSGRHPDGWSLTESGFFSKTNLCQKHFEVFSFNIRSPIWCERIITYWNFCRLFKTYIIFLEPKIVWIWYKHLKCCWCTIKRENC